MLFPVKFPPVVSSADAEELMTDDNPAIDDGMILIVASHSCDIANNNVQTDPYIELSIAREISKPDGNYAYGKNARIHHTHITCYSTDNGSVTKEYISFSENCRCTWLSFT